MPWQEWRPRAKAAVPYPGLGEQTVRTRLALGSWRLLLARWMIWHWDADVALSPSHSWSRSRGVSWKAAAEEMEVYPSSPGWRWRRR